MEKGTSGYPGTDVLNVESVGGETTSVVITLHSRFMDLQNVYYCVVPFPSLSRGLHFSFIHFVLP